MGLPSALLAALFGTPWGQTFPPRTPPPGLATDGRTVALEVLREYICSLNYRCKGPEGQPPIPFQIKPENFHIEWPDKEEDLRMPAITIASSRADYDSIGLVSYVEEDTRDRYAPGTVLQWQSEYVETINLEVWASEKAQRRAILGAIEVAITPTEQMSGLRFKMRDYFDELVCFTLNRREVMDERNSALGRRKAQLEIEMRFNIVALVNYVPLRPLVVVNTDVDGATGRPVEVDVT